MERRIYRRGMLKAGDRRQSIRKNGHP